jgi:alpha-methylacyl-CoA racemase
MSMAGWSCTEIEQIGTGRNKRVMGPLSGFTIIELAGIGPGPMGAMMLGDMGADVIRIDRARSGGADRLVKRQYNVHGRSRRSIGIDLQKADGPEIVRRLAARADGLIDPFRPGVTERLGIGPDECLRLNSRLVYCRMTGWGQEGPLAKAAGHDINYIALTGLLHAIGRKGDKPVPPLNLVGDFGGGGMLLAFGMVCGLLEAQRSGKGQVVDVAMTDGAALLFGAISGLHSSGFWTDERGTNLLDSGAHFYDAYETSDGKYISIGSIEPQFYAILLEKVGLAGADLPAQMDRTAWPALKDRFGEIFKTKTRDEWCRIMEGTDVCFAPVLGIGEAPHHPHNQARQAFINVEGAWQPAPGPRFNRTPPAVQGAAPERGAHTDDVLANFGYSTSDVEKLRQSGTVV